MHARTLAKVSAGLESLRREFASELGDRLVDIGRLWTAVCAAEDVGAALGPLSALQRAVHELAGSGRSFGFPAVSDAAIPLDLQLRELVEGRRRPDEAETARLGRLVGWLIDAGSAPPVPVDAMLGDGPDGETGTWRDGIDVFLSPALGLAESDPIVTVLREQGFAPDFGLPGPERLAALADSTSVVLVQDISEAVESPSHLAARGESEPFRIFVSRRNDFESRLRAVRAGGGAFLGGPLDARALLQQLGARVTAVSRPPIRAVVVEDDRNLARFYELSLQRAGISARSVQVARDLLALLPDFDPDIILIDLYMPGCDGVELAQIIQQHGGYTDLPILFLSTDTRESTRRALRRIGADDFLIKPVDRDELVLAVTARAQRYRHFRDLMDRDSLTGLDNHTKILRTLHREILIAARSGAPLSIAMIDIDRFKSVNDRYGHLVGDQVLWRLAGMLAKRLRRSDYLGRYGGEEFLLVLPGTAGADALRLVDKLREEFAAIEHLANGDAIGVTFSAGVASVAEFAEEAALLLAADQALYVAKGSGRNRVCQASPGMRH